MSIKYKKGETMSLEYQRYGRNKSTAINNAYINSGLFRRKFDKITKHDKINKILYSKAKEMLKHRSGTLYEDMYWIDGDTGEVVASALDEQTEEKIEYTKSIFKAINGKDNLVTMHTHPHSMPPSIADFNSCFKHNYAVCLVICHDGTIYSYTSAQRVQDDLYQLYVKEFRNNRNTKEDAERNAQLAALTQISRNYKIHFQEVE